MDFGQQRARAEEERHPSLLPFKVLGFWITTCTLFEAAGFVATIAVKQRSTVVKPAILGLALIILVLSGVCLVWYTSRRIDLQQVSHPDTRMNAIVVGAALGFVISLPVILLFAAISPNGTPFDLQREYVIAPPSDGLDRRFATVLLFDNGQKVLRGYETKRLTQDIEILGVCNIHNIEIKGFASSAHYRLNNELNNLTLANDRANVVARGLKNEGIDASNVIWPTFIKMDRNKRIKDVSADGKRLIPREALNRRVEISWLEGANCPEETVLEKPRYSATLK